MQHRLAPPPSGRAPRPGALRALAPLTFAALALASVPGCADDPEPASEAVNDATPGAGDDTAAADAVTDAGDGGAPEDTGPDVPARPPLAGPIPSGQVVAGTIATADERLSGPKAEGRVGDIRLANAHVAFVVEGVRRASGYHYWGGYVTDADVTREPGVPGEDRYGELALTWNLMFFVPDSLEILSDGADGLARVRVEGHTEPAAFGAQLLGDALALSEDRYDVAFDYELGPDDTALSWTVTTYHSGPMPSDVDFPLVVSNSGDGAYPFQPRGGYDDTGFGALPYLSAVGVDVSYALTADEALSFLFRYQGVEIVTLEGYRLEPGEAREQRLQIHVSDRGAAGPVELGWRASETALTDVTVSVTGAEGWVEPARVVVRDAEGDLVSWAPARGGAATLSLPAGEYTVRAWVQGLGGSSTEPLTVPTGGDVTGPTLALPTPAMVRVDVTDDAGAPTHARVSFIRLSDTPSPWLPSDIGPPNAWGGGVSQVVYAVGGAGSAPLLPGAYRAVASHGPAWEIDEQEITVAAGDELTLPFTLTRAVDTTGWVSADFHVHALWSPDSHVPYDVRTRQAVTDGLDLPVITEHVYVGDLAATAAQLEVEGDVITLPAQEVTTFAYGHFNAFPLVLDPEAPNLGAVFPYDKQAPALFEAIRAQSPGDELIQINHPRGSGAGAYFTYVGLDADADTVSVPEHWSTNWDLVEVFNGGCGQGAPYDDWVGLTNHGHRKVLSSGSDTHGESKPPGSPRNWIRLDPELVRQDAQNLVPPVRARDMVVSCGPFVRFQASDGTPMGGLTAVDGQGVAHFDVSVEAPTWMTVDTVRVIVGGEVAQEIPLDAVGDDPVIRFADVVSVPAASDTWVAIHVLGSGDTRPMLFGGPPNAFTNPIEVDADGDGEWTPPALGDRAARTR